MKRFTRISLAGGLILPCAIVAGWMLKHTWQLYLGSERYSLRHRIEFQPLGLFDPWSKVFRISDPWSDVLQVSLAVIGIVCGIFIAKDAPRKSVSTVVGIAAVASIVALGAGGLTLLL